MTPRERVMEVLKMPWRPDPDPYSPGRREFLYHEELEGRLEQAIIAAIAEEREACALIADEKADRVQSRNELGWGMISIANSIATAIRDRPTASSHSVSPVEK